MIEMGGRPIVGAADKTAVKMGCRKFLEINDAVKMVEDWHREDDKVNPNSTIGNKVSIGLHRMTVLRSATHPKTREFSSRGRPRLGQVQMTFGFNVHPDERSGVGHGLPKLAPNHNGATNEPAMRGS